MVIRIRVEVRARVVSILAGARGWMMAVRNSIGGVGLPCQLMKGCQIREHIARNGLGAHIVYCDDIGR